MSKLSECVNILDSKRVPLSGKQRENLKKIYPYYGAQGIIDYVDDFIFDGEYILVAEDGNNLKSLNENIATWVSGQFWVNNHAHILGEKKGYNLKYIYYLINSLDLRGYITGSAQPKLNQDNLSMIEIEVPNKSIQDRIANVLSVLDNKIKNNSKISTEFESMAKTLYDYWFLQFEFPNEEGKPYKSSGGKIVWNEELKREIPEGWRVVRIGELFTSNRGISYNSNVLEKNGIPMINLASFKPGGGYKVEGIKNYSGNYEKEKILKPYDLVMCNTQQTAIDFSKDIIGKVFLVPDIFDKDIVSSHHVTKLSVESESLKYYLYRLFCTDYFHKYIAGFTNGTNILGLLFNGVEDYRSEIPDEKVLQKFASIISNIEQKKNEIIKENQELASLRDFLLPLLMNGRIGFKDN